MYTAIVYAPSGDTVNLREQPTTNSKIITKVKVDTEVDVLAEPSSEWSRISAAGKIGYMKREFLMPISDHDEGDYVVLRLRRDLAVALMDELSSIV